MQPGLAMAQAGPTGLDGQVETQIIREPVDGWPTILGNDASQPGAGKPPGYRQDILIQMLGLVLDACLQLQLRSGRTNRSIGHASRTEGPGILFQDKDFRARLARGESSGQPAGASAYDQYGHYPFGFQ
jgi:hypothetical protein